MSKQLEILQILFRNDKPKSWLQNELKKKGIDKDLQYLLDETRSKNFDVNIYETIIEIFREHGIIPTESDRIKKLRSKVMEINGIIASGLTLLNETMNDYLNDDELTFDEKNELLEMIDGIEKQYSHLDELKILIKK